MVMATAARTGASAARGDLLLLFTDIDVSGCAVPPPDDFIDLVARGLQEQDFRLIGVGMFVGLVDKTPLLLEGADDGVDAVAGPVILVDQDDPLVARLAAARKPLRRFLRA